MTKGQSVRYGMLRRVREFGNAHRDHFPDGSVGAAALTEVAAACDELSKYAEAKMTTAGEGRHARRLARQAVAENLSVIARTARMIATRETPGFDDPFRLPKRRTDETLLTAGRVFVANAEKMKARFTARRMPEAVITELKRRVSALEETVVTYEELTREQAGAQAGIEAAVGSVTPALLDLDVIVANEFGSDVTVMAAWAKARRLQQGGRPMKTTKANGAAGKEPAGQATAPVVPIAPAPASSAKPSPESTATADSHSLTGAPVADAALKVAS